MWSSLTWTSSDGASQYQVLQISHVEEDLPFG
jgi:hypothetical protein